jgi:transcriptional regulator with XRE-family HTH domain
MITMTQPGRRDDIRFFLKALRRRLPAGTKMLGEHERLGCRRGRAVSQEELAEAVGVSRGWYAMLENGVPIQASMSMLDRLATALQANPDERATLFRLAIPLERACPSCGLPRTLAASYKLSASSTARSKSSSAPSPIYAAQAWADSCSRSDATRLS